MSLADVLAIPGLVGYWPSDPAYLYEDSGATTPASLNGVVGCWTSVGPSAIQATTAVKPYLRRTPTSNIYWLDSNTSAGTTVLTATLGNLGSSCTVAKATAKGVTFTEGVTISATYNVVPAFGFNADVAVFNRALTATEKALLTRYMARSVPTLGANLLTNGTFTSDTSGWSTSNVTAESISEELRLTSTGATGACGQASATTAGKHYRLTANCRKGATGASYYLNARTSLVAGNLVQRALTNTTTQPIEIVCLATTATTWSVGLVSATSGMTAYFDDMIFQEVL